MKQKEIKNTNKPPINKQKNITRIEEKTKEVLTTKMERRSFLKTAAMAAAATLTAEEAPAFFDFFKKHYKEMTSAEKKVALKKLEQKLKEKHGVDIDISNPAPVDDAHFVYCLDLSKCNGSRKCVTACVKENNQGRDPAIQYIKVLELDIGTMLPS